MQLGDNIPAYRPARSFRGRFSMVDDGYAVEGIYVGHLSGDSAGVEL